MIVPMKKAHVIVRSAESVATVRALSGLGVLHVEHSTPPEGADILSLADDLNTVSAAADVLSRKEFSNASIEVRGKFLQDWRAMARHVNDLWKRLDQVGEYSRMLESKIREWEEWGDFDPAALTGLAEGGVFIKLYRIPPADVKKLSGDFVVEKLKASKGADLCAVISRSDVSLQYPEVGLPKQPLSEMRIRLTENHSAMKTIRGELARHTRHLESFLRIKEAMSKELAMHEAVRGMAAEGEVSYITGYIPVDAVDKVKAKAAEERWAILIKDPSEDDNVPTLVRTPKWVSVIEPVFKLMELVPGYRELDISPLFLLFLSLFFGMIIGDAGYGLLYIAITAFFQKRLGSKIKDKKIFYLFYLFSSSAVMWGILTGTFFGQEWLAKSGFKSLLPVLNDTKFLQAFCFGLGAFHLMLGQGWQGLRKLPSLTALADAGWIMVLWASFFLARMLILDVPAPFFTNWLIAGGVALVILFTNPQKNVLKMVGSGLGTVALSIMNNFTDVISYIRLFAVGLAGVAISDTVNTLAEGFGASSPALKIFILFLGHTINIVLGPISVMVHGVRLNVLEFSSHAGLSWSGSPYKPLKS